MFVIPVVWFFTVNAWILLHFHWTVDRNCMSRHGCCGLCSFVVYFIIVQKFVIAFLSAYAWARSSVLIGRLMLLNCRCLMYLFCFPKLFCGYYSRWLSECVGALALIGECVFRVAFGRLIYSIVYSARRQQ